MGSGRKLIVYITVSSQPRSENVTNRLKIVRGGGTSFSSSDNRKNANIIMTRIGYIYKFISIINNIYITIMNNIIIMVF